MVIVVEKLGKARIELNIGWNREEVFYKVVKVSFSVVMGLRV